MHRLSACYCSIPLYFDNLCQSMSMKQKHSLILVALQYLLKVKWTSNATFTRDMSWIDHSSCCSLHLLLVRLSEMTFQHIFLVSPSDWIYHVQSRCCSQQRKCICTAMPNADFIPSKNFLVKMQTLPVVSDPYYLVHRKLSTALLCQSVPVFYKTSHSTILSLQTFCLFTQMGLAMAKISFILFAISLKDALSRSKHWKFSNVLSQNWVEV